jgi:hypothetical protein
MVTFVLCCAASRTEGQFDAGVGQVLPLGQSFVAGMAGASEREFYQVPKV